MPSGLIHLPVAASGAAVSVNSTGAGNVNTSGSTNISTTDNITVVSGNARRMLALVTVGHVNWMNSYTSNPSANSNNGGAFSVIAGPILFGDASGFRQGAVSVLELVNPNVGAHTVTMNARGSQAFSLIAGRVRCFDNVASVEQVVTQAHTVGNGQLNLSVTPDANDLAFLFAVFNGIPTLTGGAASPWWSDGNTGYSGDAKLFRSAQVAGTGAAVNFTSSTSHKSGAIALVLNHT